MCTYKESTYKQKQQMNKDDTILEWKLHSAAMLYFHRLS
jgi:hypothetical protein